MKPIDAVTELQKQGWTETAIAEAVGTSQPTINRIKGGANPLFDLGMALVTLAAGNKPKKAKRRVA